MSRIGKTPIEITSGVEVVVTADSVEVKGPKGTLAQSIPEGIEVQKEDETIIVKRDNDLRETKALHGLVRSLINNMVQGCLLYTSPSPRDKRQSRMPSSA